MRTRPTCQNGDLHDLNMISEGQIYPWCDKTIIIYKYAIDLSRHLRRLILDERKYMLKQ